MPLGAHTDTPAWAPRSADAAGAGAPAPAAFPCHSFQREHRSRFGAVGPLGGVQYKRRFDLDAQAGASAGFHQDSRGVDIDSRMYHADAFGFETMCPQFGEEFCAALGGEDHCDAAAVDNAASGGDDELAERRCALVTGETTACVGALTAAADAAIRGIREYQIVGRGSNVRDFTEAQIGFDRRDFIEAVKSG